MRFQKENTSFHPPPQIQPSHHKFSSSIIQNSAISSSQNQELPSKVSNLTNKNHHKQWKSMSISCSKGKTHALSNEFDLRPSENDNTKQQSFFNSEAIVKDGPKDGDGFKCCAFRMCLPGFGKVKPIKPRKSETKMDCSMNVMSSTFSFSFETFDINAQGRIVRENENNNEDDSISSYFELPSAEL